MINLAEIKYLEHKFECISTNINYTYLCKKCNCVAYLNINDKIPYEKIVLKVIDTSNKKLINLNLTCDEWIIKNIIE